MSRISPDDVVLGLLAAQECHGYQLLEHFRSPEQLGHVWTLSTSQLYAILKRLEQKGFIAGRAVESSDAPARIDYQLTETGQQRVDAWLNRAHPSASTRRIRTEFLSRLYIARLLNVSPTLIIDRQKASCLQRREALVQQRNRLEPGVGHMALDLVIAEIDVILQWIDRCATFEREDYDS